MKFNPKIQKNLYDLEYSRHLQTENIVINFGLALWIAFMGFLATYILGGPGKFNRTSLVISIIGTATIAYLTAIYFRLAQQRRLGAVTKIEELHTHAENGKL